VLVRACIQRELNPVPYLLALACAANVGSAATLIGNPQNMLIGSTLGLSFAGYLQTAALPVLLGLMATWAIIVASARGRWALVAAPQAFRSVGTRRRRRWTAGSQPRGWPSPARSW
jgi:Na+/H+ antiporter NhaD/arsenite permease-like protein